MDAADSANLESLVFDALDDPSDDSLPDGVGLDESQRPLDDGAAAFSSRPRRSGRRGSRGRTTLG
jgi:hypothetical protein